MISQTWCAVLLLASSLIACGYAQDIDLSAFRHPLTDLPPSGDVVVNHFFPIHATKQFPAGSEIRVVAGIHADGGPYNLTAIMGSINSPSDFKLYIQNFTQQMYYELVQQGGEVSLEYRFRPDPALPARDYQVALTLFYDDLKGGYHSTTFFNETIDVTEVQRLIDTEGLFLYLLLVGAVAAAGFWVYKSVAGTGVFKAKTKKVKQEVVKTEADEDEWLKGTHYDPKKKKGTPAAGASKKAL